MELKHTVIPSRFIRHLPRGMHYKKKGGRDFLVVHTLYCPNGHNLMADSVRIHDEPSIRIRMQTGRRKGPVFLDAFWGGHAKLYGFLPLTGSGQAARVTCPVCGVDMTVMEKCLQRGCRCTRAIRFLLPGGKNGIIVCARLGCPGHRIEIGGLPDDLVAKVSSINYPVTREDDILMEI